MRDTCGPTSGTPLASYDPDTSSWRTYGDISLWDSTPSSLTLPAWGCLRNGVLCGRPTPERLTAARESSSSPSAFPTPTAQAAKHGSTPDTTANAFGKNLWDLPSLLPTPKASDGERGRDLPRLRPDSSGRELATAVDHLLPTPTASHVSSDMTPEEWLEGARAMNHDLTWTLEQAVRHGYGKETLMKMLTDGESSRPPSTGGSALPGDGHPTLPFPE